MRRLLQTLRGTDRPLLGYVWRAGLISLLPSLVLSIVVAWTVSDEGPPLEGSLLFLVVGMLVLSPWLETVSMWPVLWLLKRLVRTDVGVAAVSAVFWGVLHSLAAPAWGLVVAWPFFVFSSCFLAWEKKSTGSAIVATALVHMFQNLLPTVALLVTR